ncbi:conserved hypothetical protein [Ricinus communis]|uniref:Uncharacterized protein n=1 Tax=Ricinus communis TaxID=3988 RepID=B9S6G0_RICCO|nr:conserved hypothetical protein [Ricinus communis]
MNLKQVITFSPQVVENMEGVCRALCFVKDDTLVLDVGGRIMAYHIRSQKAEWLTNAADAEIPKYVPYVNGLVSLAQPVASEWD